MDDITTCCHAVVDVQTKATCSDRCHEDLVSEIEREFGAEKVVIGSDGRKHRVPTRVFLKRGLRDEEILHYPEVR